MRPPEELLSWLDEMVDGPGGPMARLSDMLSRALSMTPTAVKDPEKLNRCAAEATEYGIANDADIVVRIDVIWSPDDLPVACGLMVVVGELLFVGSSAHELLVRYTGKIATPNDDAMEAHLGRLAVELRLHIASGNYAPLVLPIADGSSPNWRSFLPRVRSDHDVRMVLAYDHVKGPPLERFGPTLN